MLFLNNMYCFLLYIVTGELALLFLTSVSLYLYFLNFNENRFLLKKILETESPNFEFVANYWLITRIYIINWLFIRPSLVLGYSTNLHKVVFFYFLGFVIFVYQEDFIWIYVFYTGYMLILPLAYPCCFYRFKSFFHLERLEDFSVSIGVITLKKKLNKCEIDALIFSFFDNPLWPGAKFLAATAALPALGFGAWSMNREREVVHVEQPIARKHFEESMEQHKKFVGKNPTAEGSTCLSQGFRRGRSSRSWNI